MIIRHAEKPVSPPPFGVEEDGTQSQHALIALGWQRAGALVGFFAGPVVVAIAVPDALYAPAVVPGGSPEPSSIDDFGKSLRPIETITPLSRRLGLTPDQTYAVGDEESLAASVALKDGVVRSHGNTNIFRSSPYTSPTAHQTSGPGIALTWFGCLIVPRMAPTGSLKCRSCC